jgi:hypothetical protein
MIRTGNTALLMYPEGDCDTVTVLVLTHDLATVQTVLGGKVLTVCIEDLGIGVDDDLAFRFDDGCYDLHHVGPLGAPIYG